MTPSVKYIEIRNKEKLIEIVQFWEKWFKSSKRLRVILCFFEAFDNVMVKNIIIYESTYHTLYAIDYINYSVRSHYFRITQVSFIEGSMLATNNETILERHDTNKA